MSLTKIFIALGFIAFVALNLASPSYCGGEVKARGKLQLEVIDPEMRKAKPVLAYARY